MIENCPSKRRERQSTIIDLGKYAINGTSIHNLEFSEDRINFLMDSMQSFENRRSSTRRISSIAKNILLEGAYFKKLTIMKFFQSVSNSVEIV